MGTQFVSSHRSRYKYRMLRYAISLIFLAVSCKATSEPLPPPLLCYAEDGHDCIFPFVWQGQAFYECTTVAGPKDAASCVFPFTYNGVTHYECAYWPWGGRRQQGTHWCSTKTDRNGNHVNGQGNYGFCDCSVNLCGCYQIPNDDVQYSDAPGAGGPPPADIGDPVE